MHELLGLISETAQHTAIPLFTMSVMARCVAGRPTPKPHRVNPLCNVLSLADAFEPETAPIWESQWPMLLVIERSAFPGAYIGEIETVFADARERFPEIFLDSSFSDWLSFCLEVDLLLIYGEHILLSTTGRKFLENSLICAGCALH